MALPLTPGTRRRLLTAANVVLALTGTLAVACLVVEAGWPQNEAEHRLLGWVVYATLWLFVLLEFGRVLLQENPRAYVRAHWLEGIVVLTVLLLLVVRPAAVEQLGRLFPQTAGSRLSLVYVGLTQMALLGALVLRGLRMSHRLSARRVSPSWLVLGSFVAASLAGMLLLKLPNATHGSVSWVDAWFTAASAVSITGLVVVDTATQYTTFGQTIILGLIQLGGLGVMTFTYFLAHFLTGGISLRDRVMLGDLLSEKVIGRVGHVLLGIVVLTLAIEALGAVWLHQEFTRAGLHDRVAFQSAFHAVSAFCNAGFSTLTNGLANPLLEGRGDVFAIILALVVLGGLGFPVLRNFGECAWAMFARRSLRREIPPPRWTTSSRLALFMTGALIVGGTLIFGVLSWAEPTPSASNMPAFWTNLFNASTARTAGFNVDDVGGWSTPYALLAMLLMYIGGCPGGTAGGVRTTVFAVAWLNIWRILKERPHMELFGRRLDPALGSRAFALMLLALTWICATAIALMLLHPELSALDLSFEAVSAFSTTGLSRGVTHQLEDLGKILIIVTMIVGRVGIMVVAVAFVKHALVGRLTLPEDRVLLY